MNAPIHYLIRHRERSLLVREETPGVTRYRTSDWKQVDARMVELGVERAAHEHEVCWQLVQAERLGVPARVGFASLAEYADRRLGLKARQTEERVRVGRALVGLPLLDEALSTGELCWSKVRAATQVAVPETDAAWHAFAKGHTSTQVEKAVAYRKRGDLPVTQPDPALAKHRLSFEVRAETMALFREVQRAIRAELGGDVDDDLVLHEISRRALGGTDDDGRAPYQVAVTKCSTCELVAIEGGGDSHPVDAVVEEMIGCDAQEIPQLGDWGAPGSAGSPRATAKRATQTIPPRTRREVLRRQGACAVPGCRNSRYRHVHHVTPRSEGGGHHPVGLVCLCHRHHSAVHTGTLVIRGDADTGFEFRHADGSAYGQVVDPAAVEIATRAFEALCGLGFEMTRARQLIDAVHQAGAPATLEDFSSAALRAT